MEIIDASDRLNDTHGYSVYSVVLMAPEPISSRVQELRDAVGPERAMVAAHVTALGTFCEIENLDAVFQQVSNAAAGSSPLLLAPTGEIRESPDRSTAIAVISVTPDLQALHDRLAQAVLPTATNAYRDPAEFLAHLTFYQEIPESQIQRGYELALDFKLESFTMEGVTLMGRVGTSADGEWRLIREFVFGDG